MKKRKPSEDTSSKSFAELIGPVKRVVDDRAPPLDAPMPQVRHRTDEDLSEIFPVFTQEMNLDFELKFGSDESLSSGQQSLPAKIWKRFREGEIPMEWSLDCHGLTINEAQSQIGMAIASAKADGIRTLLVIHGKGIGQVKPKLKNAVLHWAHQHPDVLAYQSAPRRLGGSGATMLYIRRLRSADS